MLPRVLLLVAAAVAVVALAERDDLSVLRSVHAEYEAGGEPWEHALTLAREAERGDHALDGAVELFGAVLAADVRYIFHGHGECVGVAQVAACLVEEEGLRMRQRGDARGGRSVQQSSVRQGALHVVRVLDAPHEGTRLLDVYFVHLNAAGTVQLVEHLPTVRDPIAFMWRTV